MRSSTAEITPLQCAERQPAASSITGASGRGPTSRRAGLPRREWEALLRQAQEAAPTGRPSIASRLPKRYGGSDGSNLWMAVIREHLRHPGPRPAQRPAERALDRRQSSVRRSCSTFRDAASSGRVHRRQHRRRTSHHLRPDRARPRLRTRRTWKPRAVRDGAERRRRLAHRRQEDVDDRHARRHSLRALRPHQRQGRRTRDGITALSRAGRHAGRQRSRSTCGRSTCRPIIRASSFTDVWVPDDALFGELGKGLSVAQCFVHENRIRQAASIARRGGLLHQRERALRAPSASRSARRSPRTRRSSGRWSSSRRRPRCCAC